MKINQFYFLPVAFLLLFSVSCKEKHTPHIGEKKIVKKAADLAPTTTGLIQSTLKAAVENNGHVDSFYFKAAPVLQNMYAQGNFAPLWTRSGKWTKKGDSLFYLITNSLNHGLFPEDYFLNQLTKLRAQVSDTAKKENKLDASLWAQTDLLLTSAFVQIIKDIKAGRLTHDSLIRKDPAFNSDFFMQEFNQFWAYSTAEFVVALEPQYKGYHQLKLGLQKFLPTANLHPYTYIYPRDTLHWKRMVRQRLSEEEAIVPSARTDSGHLSLAIINYQKGAGLKPDGRISGALIDKLNQTDKQKLTRIIVTMDRYKQLPELPKQYIWVNIPTYQLELIEDDAVVITSKVVVGKRETPTPLLTSAISDMITYPKWHIPTSIIEKEILPNLKINTGYLASRGYSLWDWKNNEINPDSVDWSKFKKAIPYQVIQGSGDDNALGVIKFNFPNNYAVYLHDTNQRQFFSKSKRALSHGCVRVESWEELAYYLLRKDGEQNPNAVPIDSLHNWLTAKVKHVIPLRKRVPLYIRYFSCAGSRYGNIIFYDDVYGDDRKLWDQYFKSREQYLAKK